MISIVMPTHKKRPLLYATLVSVFTQNFDDYEFVVVDASPDRYFKEESDRLFENYSVLKRHADKKEKMRIVYPESNGNFPGAMKMLGFRNCTQDDDFVFFLDHDDMICSNMLKYIRGAKIQYPDTEMVTSRYTSMIYSDGYIYRNTITYAGGEVCDSSNTISVGEIWFSFEENQDIYENHHPYRAAICPKILSKKVMRDNRFRFIEDTERMDDFMWPVITHAFRETFIPAPGYVYVGYGKNDPSNSCIGSRKVSEKATAAKDSCEEYSKLLDAIGYKKPRNVYVM